MTDISKLTLDILRALGADRHQGRPAMRQGRLQLLSATFEVQLQEQTMSKPFRLMMLSFLFAVAASGMAQQSAAPTRGAGAAAVSKVYSPFIGAWTGALEYRDFQSDKRVKLPTWLDVDIAPDGRELRFHYTYDDGPAKVVRELSLVAMDTTNSTFTVTSDRDKSKDTYQMTGQDELAAAGKGALELTGTGTENDKKVDVRISIKVGRNYYRYEKETKLQNGSFEFRDGYEFTRRDPPVTNP